MSFLTSMIIPPWARWVAMILICTAFYGLGSIHEARIAGEKHLAYVNAQFAQTMKIAKAQTKVVIQTETKYRDRIRTIYLKGEANEQEAHDHVTKTDDDRCVVNAGFVRVHTAAWSGDNAGPSAESDDGPSGVPLSEVAEVEAHNAAACLGWREEVIGLREFYARLKAATDNPERAPP